MKRKTISRVGAAVAVGLLSTSALAATMMANNSNKGSLLIAPRIDVRAGVDTLVTVVNDGSAQVIVKCYYRTSDPVTTPGGGGGAKHTMDFGFRLTPHQAVTWSAATGLIAGDSALLAGQIAPPFTAMPDGTTLPVGELKCFAVANQATAPFLNGVPAAYNALYMDVSVVGAPFGTGGQAYEYEAWTFQALVGTGSGVAANPLTPTVIATQGVAGNVGGAAGLPVTAVDTPFAGEATSTLALNGAMYDGCPNILLAALQPAGGTIPGAIVTGATENRLTIVSCNQDLTEAATPVITKYIFTFWNQDELPRTGFFRCADSIFDILFTATPANAPGTIGNLGTGTSNVVIESVGDTSFCGSRARKVGILGVKESANGGAFVRGTNMIGRGVNNTGSITYNPFSADSFKK